MRFLIIILIVSLTGCGSTPYRDDYTKHVNLLTNQYIDERHFNFIFSDSQFVDLRGLYSQDNTVVGTPILYQGGAGIIGLIAQVGTHSSMINSQRNTRLNNLQIEANKKIAPLTSLTNNVSLLELISADNLQWHKDSQQLPNTVLVKPIFFSNEEMNELSLRTIFWIPSTEKRKKQKFKYQNMIHVYSSELTDAQVNAITQNDSKVINQVLSELLNISINIMKNEITGKYEYINSEQQTFVMKENSTSKVIRGSIIEENCTYQIIQDIHSWFFAYPKGNEGNADKKTIIEQC